MKFKKVITLILFALVSISGVLFGCKGKYDNMKITSDRDGLGLQLFLGEDSTIEGGATPSIGTITFSISGVGDDVSKKLLFNYDHDIIRVLDEERVGNQTTVKLQALSGGSTKFTAISEEGGKKDSVDVECTRRITSLEFNSEFNPALFNEQGNSYIFNSKYLVFNDSTTQTEVEYILVSGFGSTAKVSIDGIELTSSGKLTLNEVVDYDSIWVMVQSIANNNLCDWVNVHLVPVFDVESIELLNVTPNSVLNENNLVLTTEGDCSNVTFTVNVKNVNEKISFDYKLVEKDDTTSGNVNCVSVVNNLNEFRISAYTTGECYLVLQLNFYDYTDMPIIERVISIKVIQLPSTISVNGISNNFEDTIFTYYKNNLGKQYIVNVGDFLAYNTEYIIAVESLEDFNIKLADGSEVECALLDENNLPIGNYTTLKSGQSFYISGNIGGNYAKLYLYAVGSLNYVPLIRTINLVTYLGSQSVTPTNYMTLNGVVEKAYFVEVGKEFTLNYAIDNNSSAKGIKLLGLDDNPIENYIQVEIGEGNYPNIKVKGLKQGRLSCKLVLDNLVESETFTIMPFVDMQSFNVSVESPLTNKYIAEANYEGRDLKSFVMSLGAGVQMYLSTNPGNATIYTLSYKPFISIDGVDEIDGSEYFTVNEKSGYVIAKKYLNKKDNEGHVYSAFIRINVKSLATSSEQEVEIKEIEKDVEVEIYRPLSNVIVSKNDVTLYWKDQLNPVQKYAGVYKDTISLNLYPTAIDTSKVFVNWQTSDSLQVDNILTNPHSCTISAINMPEDVTDRTIYTLTVTIHYYSTVVVKRVTINVIKPVRADKLTVYVDDDYDNGTAYFDISNGISNAERLQIHANVFSATGEENVTFNTIYYRVDQAYKNYANVTADGFITPKLAGNFEIMVFSQDMVSTESTENDLIPTQYRIINVVIADGRSNSTALRIRTEEDFYNLLQDCNEGKYYYFARDIALSSVKDYYVSSFNSKIDGRGFNLQNLNINNQYGCLIGEIEETSLIKNLNVYVSLSAKLQQSDLDYYYSALSLINRGTISCTSVYFTDARINVQNSFIQSLSFAGLTSENYGLIQNCSVNANLRISSNEQSMVNNLYIGGLCNYNYGNIEGLNRNYNYSSSSTQEYEFDGSINVDENIIINAVDGGSYIGGISSINTADGVIGAYNSGVAADIEILAKTINNVGGLTGVNYGEVKNSLAKVNILASNNVGGICGISNSNKREALENVVVELYQDVKDLEKFAFIIGNDCVGGLVGCLLGNIREITITDDETGEQWYEYRQELTTLSSSYIKAYANDCYVSGNEFVGGIVGSAMCAGINCCYAYVNLIKHNFSNETTTAMVNVGGVAGKIEASDVNMAYYIGTIESNSRGSLFAQVIHNEHEFETNVSQFYSPANPEFVYDGEDSDYSIKESYNRSDNLTEISTYNAWSITTTESDLYSYDWYINSSKNSGYPQLIYRGNIMHKLTPSDIYINVNDQIKTDNGVLLLNTNKNYKINELLTITTDVDARATIYAFCNIETVLLPSSSNKLNSKTYLRSSSSQIITLTFVLGNNPNIRKSIQIAFVDEVLALKTENINIKKGSSATVIAEFSKEKNKLDEFEFELIDVSSYKLGIKYDEKYFDNDNQENRKLRIYDSEIEEINGEEIILFNNNSILEGIESVYNENKFELLLFYKLSYIDLNNVDQVIFVRLSQCEFDIKVYTGADSIQISNSYIDMTLIEDVTFDVTLKTDRNDDEIRLQLNCADVYVNESLFTDNVVLVDSNTGDENAKLILSLLNSPVFNNGELVATFNIKFNEKYFNLDDSETYTSFNKVFNFGILFSDAEDRVSTSVNVTAKPQNLLKIDALHYPAGKVESNTYILTSSIDNTLTPGQQGLLVIDIYPEYAQFDYIEVKSGTDNKGNRISFIQSAQYYDKDSAETNKLEYLELRPSSVLIEDGIRLQRISNITKIDESEVEYTFDGKFYVKTLMGTNVDYDQLVTVSIIGVSLIKNENGEIIENHTITRTLDIIVNQAPSVKLEYKGNLYQKFVKHYIKTESDTLSEQTQLYNLTTIGSTLEFDISYYKLSLTNISTNVSFVDLNNPYNSADIEASQVCSVYLTSNRLYLNINENCRSGILVKVSISGKEIVNNYAETYESNVFEFVVVDYLIKSIDVNNGVNIFEIGEVTPVQVNISVISGLDKEKTSKLVENLEKEINENWKYWYKYVYNVFSPSKSGFEPWHLEHYPDGKGDISPNKREILDVYDVYGLNQGDGSYSLNIYAKKQSGLDSTFKVLVPYFYDYTEYLPVSEVDIYDPTSDFDRNIYYGINLNVDLSDEQSHNEDLYKLVSMNLVTVTNIDNPIPIYTVEEFYNMKNNAELDYILMNDLYFGVPEEEVVSAGVESGDEGSYVSGLDLEEGQYTTNAYTPFELNVKSLDGNVHSVNIYGNINVPRDENNLGLFTSINSGTILVNLDVKYKPKNTGNKDAINFTDANALNISTLNFGGLTAVNNGVVSNCNVYYEGNIVIDLKENNSQINFAGFASQNSNKITYSSVFGPDWNSNYNKEYEREISYDTQNVKLQTKNPGMLATFVNNNSNLLSNCQSEFLGLENNAHASLSAKVAGFVTNNSGSGRIINCSVAGQRLSTDFDNYVNYGTMAENGIIEPIYKNDVRIENIYKNILGKTELSKAELKNIANMYFARLYSQSNIGGFIFTNSGTIQDSYSYIPMETQGRTAGFAYDNSNAGKITTSYNLSVYDGVSRDNFAHSPFIGTDELGIVLNNELTSEVNYCYYLVLSSNSYEEELITKEPASRIGIDLKTETEEAGSGDEDESSKNDIITGEDFVGFDVSSNWSTWKMGLSNYSNILLLSDNVDNQEMRPDFRRNPIEIEVDGIFTLKFPRASSEKVPYTIANELQFVNTFTKYSGEKDARVLKRDIRMINDIDFAQYAGTEEFDNIKNTIYIGKFDGNGMKISNLKLTGSSSDSNNSGYSNVSSSYGLFYQVGTASIFDDDGVYAGYNLRSNDNKTVIKNLTLGVKEVSRSTSAFSGILAGVIVNSEIKSLTINASGVNVLGKNAVGGLAGAVIGSSTLHSISINANVFSTYLNYSNTTYSSKELYDVDRYKYIDYASGYSGSGADAKFNITSNISNCSYAGGIAGIIDVCYNTDTDIDGTFKFGSEPNKKGLIIDSDSNKPANFEILNVYGDVTISGEIVGGLFGAMNNYSYVRCSKFELSDSDSQRLFGFYTSGGLVGMNRGGVIYISTVELSKYSYGANDDQLTNLSGASLFRSDSASNPDSNINVYPYAIGGMVGVQQGGYIISSYSKTNVINTNAKYAGGLIGYLRSYIPLGSSSDYISLKPQQYLWQYPLLDEVYSTGNVLSVDGYKKLDRSKQVIGITKSGTIGTISIDVYAPKGYVGGIAGGYYASEYDQFNGIIGINAFHQPENYTNQNSEYLPISVSNGDSDSDIILGTNGGSYITTALKYGDLAGGYYGVKRLSTGEYKVIYFDTRVGAIFGEVNGNYWSKDGRLVISPFDTKGVDPSGGEEYHNIFTKFAYNSISITWSDCTNANGKEIKYIAQDNCICLDEMKLDSYLQDDSQEDELIDYYSSYGERATSTHNIYLNQKKTHKSSASDETEDKDIDYYFSSAETYLVLRGKDTYGGFKYSTLNPNKEGVYQNWGDNWICEYPVYPALKPSSVSFYIDISNEEELKHMTDGGKYRLVSDIYLSNYWEPQQFRNITFISAKREDGLGIRNEVYGSALQSQYYCIYNINIWKNSSGPSFYSLLKKCKIQNINYVYGTTLDDPNIPEGKHTWQGTGTGELGVKYDHDGSKADNRNYGLFVGSLMLHSTLDGIQVFLNTSPIDETHTPSYTVKVVNDATRSDRELSTSHVNVGGLIGSTISSEGSSGGPRCTVRKCGLYMGELNATGRIKTFKELEDADKCKLSVTTEKTTPSSSIIEAVDANYDEINIGGIVGYYDGEKASFDNNNIKGMNICFNKGTDKWVDLNSLNIGSIAGRFNGGEIYKCKVDGCNISVERILSRLYVQPADIGSAHTTSTINIGGAVGSTESAKIEECSYYKGKISVVGLNWGSYKSKTVPIMAVNSDVNIGGFIGSFSGNYKISECSANLSDIIVSPYIDTYTKTNNVNGISIGGFVGDAIGIGDAETIEKNIAKFDTISVSGLSVVRQSHIAGFAGLLEKCAENCLAQGNIKVDGLIFNDSYSGNILYVTGFAGAGYEGSDSGYDKWGKISNSVADVNITSKCNNKKLKLAGFAGDYFKEIIKSVSLGDVKFDYGDQSAVFEGYVSGFVVNDVGKNATTTDKKNNANFCLTSVDIVGGNCDDDCRIKPTSFASGDAIFYSYNLTGVMDNNPSDCCVSYSDLLLGEGSAYDSAVSGFGRYYNMARAAVNNNLAGLISAKNLNQILYGSDTPKQYAGTKLYPYLLRDFNSETNVEGNYFFISKNSSTTGYADGDGIIYVNWTDGIKIINPKLKLTIDENTINANLIADYHKTALTFNLSIPLAISSGAKVSGIEFATAQDVVNMNYFISKNEGYIFNCLTTGRILNASGNMSGFVNENTLNGKVNGCLSMAFIDTNYSSTASTAGFVLQNAGIIINSAATNVFFKISKITSVQHSGFVHKNFVSSSAVIKAGIIQNCFASGSMFDVDVETDENFGNTYDFYNASSGLSIYGTLTNNYFDRYSNSENVDDQEYVKSKSFSGSCEWTAKVYRAQNVQLNYGYSTPTTFDKTAGNFDEKILVKEIDRITEKYDIATYFTGNSTEDKPYLINNVGRLWKQFYQDTNPFKSDTNYLKMLNSFNAKHWVDEDVDNFGGKLEANESSSTVISIDNSNIYNLHNICVSTKNVNDCVGLFSAKTVVLKNLGVVGEFKNSTINASAYSCISLVLAKAIYAQLENCYAISKESVTIDGIGDAQFGLLAGLIYMPDNSSAGTATLTSVKLNNCFASGNVVKANNNTYTKIGVLAGYVRGTGKVPTYAENCFATGEITIEDDDEGWYAERGYTGGIFGLIYSDTSLKNTYSVVSILNKNRTLTSDSNIYALGYTDGGEVADKTNNFYNEYISLCDVYEYKSVKIGTRKTTAQLLANPLGEGWTTSSGIHFPIQTVFTSNSAAKSIINRSLAISTTQTGSRMSPIAITDRNGIINAQADKVYYLANDISTSQQITKGIDMLIGDNYTITRSGADLLNNDAKDIIISGVTVKNTPLSSNFGDGYAYKVKVDGEVSGQYGFADNAGENAVFDQCETSGKYFGKPKDSTVYNASGFVYNAKKETKFKQIKMQSSFSGEANEYSGITATRGFIIGETSVKLNIKYAKVVGGICARCKSDDTTKTSRITFHKNFRCYVLDSDDSVTLSNVKINSKGNLTFGCIFGIIDGANWDLISIYNNIDKYEDLDKIKLVKCNNTWLRFYLASEQIFVDDGSEWIYNASEKSELKAGILCGELINESRLHACINDRIVGTIEQQCTTELFPWTDWCDVKFGLQNIGGVCGYLNSNCNLRGFKTDINMRVTTSVVNNRCYVGGIVGYMQAESGLGAINNAANEFDSIYVSDAGYAESANYERGYIQVIDTPASYRGHPRCECLVGGVVGYCNQGIIKGVSSSVNIDSRVSAWGGLKLGINYSTQFDFDVYIYRTSDRERLLVPLASGGIAGCLVLSDKPDVYKSNKRNNGLVSAVNDYDEYTDVEGAECANIVWDKSASGYSESESASAIGYRKNFILSAMAGGCIGLASKINPMNSGSATFGKLYDEEENKGRTLLETIEGRNGFVAMSSGTSYGVRNFQLDGFYSNSKLAGPTVGHHTPFNFAKFGMKFNDDHSESFGPDYPGSSLLYWSQHYALDQSDLNGNLDRWVYRFVRTSPGYWIDNFYYYTAIADDHGNEIDDWKNTTYYFTDGEKDGVIKENISKNLVYVAGKCAGTYMNKSWWLTPRSKKDEKDENDKEWLKFYFTQYLAGCTVGGQLFTS